jgi:predicted transcriptional regulator
MKTKSRECQTLKEYREQVLAMPQVDVARRAGVSQARISAIERGRIPRRWNWKPFVSAYDITEQEFERMVLNAAKVNALQQPIAHTEPLIAAAQTDGRVEAIEAMRCQNAQVIGQTEIRKASEA